jgi:RES domain-containing protein
MKVYRLCKSAWKHDLSGRGAEITGGRWNSKGVPVLYTSSSRALCMVEIAVHTPMGTLPTDYFMVEIDIPDTCKIEIISENDLPRSWESFAYMQITQFMGDNFIKKNLALVLKVPSAVVRGDFNYLINPGHKDTHSIKIENISEFGFDRRLFGEKK